MLLRTAAIPSAQTLDDEKIHYIPLDFIYERSRNYDTLARNLAREVRARAKGKKVCYCVDGDASEDAAARLLIARGAKAVGGRSKGAYFAERAALTGEYTAVSAFSVGERALALPLVVYDVTQDNLPDIKLFLAEKYGDEAPAMYISVEKNDRMPLFSVDRERPAGLCGIVVYDVPLLEKKVFTFEDFIAILRRLRAPDGCPWDKVQTHESIRINAIEEAYELVDAIDRGDVARMLEETGDVLMQAAFHALIEEEKGGFTVADMLTAVSEKLITRHTHIFGKDRAQDAEGALSVWDQNKMKEKGQNTYADAVNDVPECFPALLRAQKIAKRMEKGGWDAATLENFEKKFREEYGELLAAHRAGDKTAVAEELGDVLFCTVELGRAVGVDCEMALLDTVKKCAARYTAYEGLVRADGKDVHALTEAEKADYYGRAKDAARD